MLVKAQFDLGMEFFLCNISAQPNKFKFSEWARVPLLIRQNGECRQAVKNNFKKEET